MSLCVEIVKGKSALLKTAQLRTEVFEHEQGFIDEFDDLDHQSVHVIVIENDEVIASGRMYEENLGTYHLGRIVVKKQRRKQGYGALVVQNLLKVAQREGAHQCVLSSQTHACAFYERLGFVKEGPVYDEQGQPHQWMSYNLKRKEEEA